ncbi:diadenylate cyclase [Mariprofundus ferrinatatus]|uniref:Diadenylate cyclase n=1 Tax=Mariprofundus ferrinatatus TaxID=1921087 RepID=A0A2K8L4I4_9PROT|nr:diadenylate cyclase [Mariprofundus ferrinatatus]ATX81149.1 diadenylate cyclase [Mariprofundus ferrinatatus]
MANWQFGLVDVLDISVVAIVVYFFLSLIRGTRAVQMLIGVAVVVVTYQLARTFGLFTVEWMFGHFFSAFMVILVVLFQQEIRRALMRVAANPLSFTGSATDESIDSLVESAFSLVHRGWGGLIVIERETGLRHLFESGVEMDAPLRPDIIQALFCPDAPMHDGAVIMRRDGNGGRIVAARVLLPLAQANAVPGDFGTRHRAAVGLSEETDALIVVVSEERGEVHLVEGGQMGAPMTSMELREALGQLAVSSAKPAKGPAGNF